MYPGPVVEGTSGRVSLGGWALDVVPGTWRVEPAPQFGERISIGELTHDDMDPNTDSHIVTSLTGGYGLRRYSDLTDRQRAQTMYDDTDFVDNRYGRTFLAQVLSSDTVESSVGTGRPLTWLADIPWGTSSALITVGIFGERLYKRNSNGTWTQQGSDVFVSSPTCAAFFNNRIIVGYGSGRKASALDSALSLSDVENDSGTDLFVWAITSDNAQCYIAGGTSSSADFYKVMASTTHTSFQASSVTPCGSPDEEITDLAPGGGVAIVYVGKDGRLGAIGNDGIFHTLVPFDTRTQPLSLGGIGRNCEHMTWWLGRVGEEQRGPMILAFPKEDGLWVFEPSGGDPITGRAQDVSPWAVEGIRPKSARGRIIGIQGTARWLYYTIKSVNTSNAGLWLLAMDARTGAHHTIGNIQPGEIGIGSGRLFIASASDGVPRLFFDAGTANTDLVIDHVRIPADGGSPLETSVARYSSTGTLTYSDMDLGFPDEDKVLFSVRLSTENVAAGKTILIEYALDGATSWTTLGTMSSGSYQEFAFPSTTTCKRVKIRVSLSTDNSEITPVILSLTLKASLNLKTYKQFTFTARFPAGELQLPTDGVPTQKLAVDTYWDAKRDGIPIQFLDRWGEEYKVRIIGMRESEPPESGREYPQTMLDLVLLEVSKTTTAPILTVVT